jgi:hypothetical protein
MDNELGAWAARQRWYAGKSHEPRFRLIDQQPVPGATRFLVMDDAGERPTLYQVPISARDGRRERAGRRPHRRAGRRASRRCGARATTLGILRRWASTRAG